MDSPETIGKRLRYLRNLRGWTVYNVEKLVGIPSSLLSQYERGHVKQIPILRLAALCDLYGASIDWVLTGEVGPKDIQRRWPDGFLELFTAATEQLSQDEKNSFIQLLKDLLAKHTNNRQTKTNRSNDEPE